MPVSVYLIEHPKGLILVDTGWHRDMSPEGVYDKAAQIKSLGSRVLYNVNQGQIPLGEAVDEQLETMGIKPADLDYVLLTHLDCDHANGLRAVKDAKRIVVTPVVSRTVNGCQLHREPCHSRHRHQTACDRVVARKSFINLAISV